jgi:hypothetical protein
MRRHVTEKASEVAKQNGWKLNSHGRRFFEKDGYRVFMFKHHDGFELNFRNPETMERETILQIRDGKHTSTASPLYVAAVQNVLKEAETIVAENTDYEF